jgi:hypothetical protein
MDTKTFFASQLFPSRSSHHAGILILKKMEMNSLHYRIDVIITGESPKICSFNIKRESFLKNSQKVFKINKIC